MSILDDAKSFEALLASVQAVVTSHTAGLRELAARLGLDIDVDFQGRDLRGIDLQGHDLSGFNFANADLSGADLRNTGIQDGQLIGAKLDGAALDDSHSSTQPRDPAPSNRGHAGGKIMVVRHGEMPGDPSPPWGTDRNGAQDKDSLIVRGWQRSGALACLLSKWGVATRPGLAVPAAVYATEPGSKNKRPLETVSAISELLGLQANTSFGEGHERELAAAAKAATGPVLIGWHHEGIPAIANFILGNDTTAPQIWPSDRFDMVWVFDLKNDSWTFSQLPQMALYGDSHQPIPTDRRAAAALAVS
jgi:hypothetical protein